MRFSLTSLLLAFVVFWASLASFGIAGLAMGGGLLGIVASFRLRPEVGEPVPVWIAWRVLLPACLLLGLGIVLQTDYLSGESSRERQCRVNLSQIQAGLYNYHNTYGCFPPAHALGPDGRPWHSWRVLILPFVGQEDLYRHYDFDEPWNGPNNRRLAVEKPDFYGCPSDSDAWGFPTTSYAAVVGPRAAWAGSEPRRLDEFRDRTEFTIIVVEVADSGIHWMEPRDLSFDEAGMGVHPPGPGRISSRHTREHGHFYRKERLAQVAMADGYTFIMGEWDHQPTLEAMLTIDGNEPIDLDVLLGSRRKPNWPRIFAHIVLLVALFVLLLRPRKRRETTPQGATPCDSA